MVLDLDILNLSTYKTMAMPIQEVEDDIVPLSQDSMLGSQDTVSGSQEDTVFQSTPVTQLFQSPTLVASIIPGLYP